MPTPMKLLPLLRGSPFAFPLAALAALAMFLISESSYQQASTTFVELGKQAEASSNIQVLWRSLTDAETGQRGYLLTGRKEYLRPYVEAQGRVGNSLAWLNDYYSREPEIGALMHREGVSRRCALGDVSVRPPSGARWPKAALGRAIRDAVRPVLVVHDR